MRGMSYRITAVLFAACAAFSSLNAATAAVPAPAASAFVTATRHLPASTCLDTLEIYSMAVPSTSAALAHSALSVEIERLYTHAKTLASGPERRAFETRIYHFEKRLRPLASSFNVTTWESLRADVRSEWISIQSTTPASPALAAAY